jgi:hypothetical protein
MATKSAEFYQGKKRKETKTLCASGLDGEIG